MEAKRRDSAQKKEWVVLVDGMDITGARWGLTGAEAVLRIRSILKSPDFDEDWNYHIEQEYQRNHVAKLFNLIYLIDNKLINP